MEVLGIVQEIQGFFHFRRFRTRLLGGCRCQIFTTDTALLADLREMPVDVGNQLRSGLIDGFQTGTQLLQLLALGPGSNIAEAVLGSLNIVIFAHGIGNALGLHFLGAPVLDFNFGSRRNFLNVQPPFKAVLVNIPPTGSSCGSLRITLGLKAYAIITLGPAVTHHDDLPG